MFFKHCELFLSTSHFLSLSLTLSVRLSLEAEQSSSPSRTGVGSDQEDSRTATMGNAMNTPVLFYVFIFFNFPSE